MEKQENLRDSHGNPPELSFYTHERGHHEDPNLVFKDKDGFWKARHYLPREILDMKLTQLYFEECIKISNDEIQELITDYEQKSRNLRLSLETKKQLSELESETESA